MQEYGWQHWNDFSQMAWLVVPDGDQRKVRLAACAIVHRLTDRMTDTRTRTALDAAEGFADFRIRRQELRRIAAYAGDVVRELEESLFTDKSAVTETWSPHWHPEYDESSSLEWQLRHRGRSQQAAGIARLVAQVAEPRALDAAFLDFLNRACWQILDPQKDRREGQAPHCDLLRAIFGNPFRPVAFDNSWRTEAVVALARGMYELRDFGAMPVLADALDDAGCDDPDVLAHCRGAGPHVRGCWVVDLVLGKA